MAIDQLTEDNRKLTVTITELNAVLQEQVNIFLFY